MNMLYIKLHCCLEAEQYKENIFRLLRVVAVLNLMNHQDNRGPKYLNKKTYKQITLVYHERVHILVFGEGYVLVLCCGEPP